MCRFKTFKKKILFAKIYPTNLPPFILLRRRCNAFSFHLNPWTWSSAVPRWRAASRHSGKRVPLSKNPSDQLAYILLRRICDASHLPCRILNPGNLQGRSRGYRAGSESPDLCGQRKSNVSRMFRKAINQSVEFFPLSGSTPRILSLREGNYNQVLSKMAVSITFPSLL